MKVVFESKYNVKSKLKLIISTTARSIAVGPSSTSLSASVSFRFGSVDSSLVLSLLTVVIFSAVLNIITTGTMAAKSQ